MTLPRIAGKKFFKSNKRPKQKQLIASDGKVVNKYNDVTPSERDRNCNNNNYIKGKKEMRVNK